METTNEISNTPKERHGCVTTWLVLMIIVNAVLALVYLFAGDTISENIPGGISTPMLILLGVFCVLNVLFSVLLLKWKKLGFWGFVLSSVAALIINLSIGLNIAQSLGGLIGIFILYAILQIKKNNVTAWANLE